MDMEKLLTYGDSLIEILKDDKDIVALKHCPNQSKAIQSQCDIDFNQVRNSIQDYTKKIDDCKKKTAAAESESVSEAQLNLLQKELEEEQQRESMLRQELRAIIDEIADQECQVEEQSQSMKKHKKDEMRAQMKLSMYASVTKIIPCLDDQSKISGHIVEKEKNVVEKFEFVRSEVTPFDTCNNIWKMIDQI